MKFVTCATLLALALITGCASSGKMDTNTPAAAVAPGTSASPTAPSATAVTTAAKQKVVLHMSGQATVTGAKDWAAFKDEWRSTFSEHAQALGMDFSMPDSVPNATGETGYLIQVYVNDYRMVGIGARIFLGIMTGNAYVDATATFADLNSGARFSERVYNTSSTAWAGVFAKMTPQQVDSIATQVFAEIKRR